MFFYAHIGNVFYGCVYMQMIENVKRLSIYYVIRRGIFLVSGQQLYHFSSNGISWLLEKICSSLNNKIVSSSMII